MTTTAPALDELRSWIGRTETSFDVVTATPAHDGKSAQLCIADAEGFPCMDAKARLA